MTNENMLRISNPTRIARIIERICQANLPVILRQMSDSSIAVKGRAVSLSPESNSYGLRISNISEMGIQHLIRPDAKIQVEFVMMSTKVLFVSQIISSDSQSVVLSMPSVLVSVERRKNARYSTTDEHQALVQFSVWKADGNDMTAPPVFFPESQLASFIQIADLSYGGMCVVTRFPSLNTVLRRGLIDEKAKIILPLAEPFEVSLEVRWVKRIKEHIAENESKQIVRSYRFGLEFVKQPENVKIAIHQFIQKVSQSGAI